MRRSRISVGGGIGGDGGRDDRRRGKMCGITKRRQTAVIQMKSVERMRGFEFENKKRSICLVKFMNALA
jgi:hypothetical protein